MKPIREWSIRAPWGDIALISWGREKGPPILLVHGRQDSAATFQPLLKLLPNNYHYVALDLPGHGKSCAFPKGTTVSRIHFVTAVKEVVDSLRWQRFVYMAHSMGTEMGFIYNAVYPGHIEKFILLDPGPSFQRLQLRPHSQWYQLFYADYYEHYDNYNNNRRLYKKENALQAVRKARNLNRNEAEIVLSRNLQRVDDDHYRLSWDKRLKYPPPLYLKQDYYTQLFTKESTDIPILMVVGRDPDNGNTTAGQKAVESWLKILQKQWKHSKMVEVDGTHDVHLTNPERFVNHVVEFLGGSVKAKL